MREDQVSNGVTFLTHPKVQNAPFEERLVFLRNKGLTEDEIQEAVRRSKGSGDEKSGESNTESHTPGTPGASDQHGGQQPQNNAPPHFPRAVTVPPPPVQDESSWVSKYLVPGTLALSAGAGMAFLYKTMVLKENMGGPRQWFGPGPPPPGVYGPGMPMQQQQQMQGQPMQQQQQMLQNPFEATNNGQQQIPQNATNAASINNNKSLPGAPGAMEALVSQGKPIPSLAQFEKDQASGRESNSTSVVPYESGSMFGSAPYASGQTFGGDLTATGFGGSDESRGFSSIIAKQTELLQDVSNSLKSVTTQLADIKSEQMLGGGGFGMSTSGSTQAMLANLSQTTSDLKAEMNTLKMLILSGKLGGSNGGTPNEDEIRKLLGPIDEKLAQQQQNRNQLDQLIKATSGATSEETAPTAAEEEQPQADPEPETDEKIAQEKIHASRTALAEMVKACPADKLRPAVNILLLYLRNLAKDPEVPRYGRIARTNQSYINNLGEVEHHLELLKANGFEERNPGGFVRAPTLEWSEKWRENKDKWALQVLKDTITNLETVNKQGASAAPAATSAPAASPTPPPVASTPTPPPQATTSSPSSTSVASKPKQSSFVAPPFTIPSVPSPPLSSATESASSQAANDVRSTPAQQANGSTETSSEEPRYPLSYSEICKYVQKGQEPPGIKKVPDSLSGDPPSAATMAPLRKPWERQENATQDEQPEQENTFQSFAQNGAVNPAPQDVVQDVPYDYAGYGGYQHNGYGGYSKATIEEINEDQDPSEAAPEAAGGEFKSEESSAPSINSSVPTSGLPFPEVETSSEVASVAP
mmetsp:Transcript_5049/g.8312  ORF Transcript_5049/g.8312 Transcript_5049/m.8312 type:complete len:814 (+) Transcript_5049:107-2548(+)|eukprot:CAMPEP_0171499670 /NCGR_PEP_ID=MMETSP0958-20121227/8559_1 /TAXON_ID=87120 /ORGANISM="Aurantiochytrium limacinum, Strain ATCCMYA-1381" /LENGTH=813 /DNA_ID=CAMNT_0012034255 /DNA_START=109 /DNA_END=2550 /DNA_ORIENTATION=-